MSKDHSVPEASSSTLRELDSELLENVRGGGGEKVTIPTEQCPACMSGTDPKVENPRFQRLLAGDL